ncbi:MAG TPA: hypothetical protein VG248_02795 [Caulobacteraceae bacterium]|jgi:hypothetical protein|nr:hypothetical protein [Caulobacteraceae bacterium]
MSTVRAAILEAMRLMKAVAPGDAPTADELAVGLDGAQSLVLALHEARGPLWDLDVTADICPGENQRLRIQAGAIVTVTLPNAVSILGGYDPYDYGFQGAAGYTPQTGTTGSADGVQYRQPTDGARIEVVGTTQALYFYRVDTNAWAPASGLTLDTELPLNARYQSDFAVVLAERLADVLSNLPEPTKPMLARIAASREALFSRPGVRREPVRASYF